VCLAITVQSDGFAGEGSAWVEAPQLRRFCGQLRQLETQLGRTELESMSPGEFRLTVLTTDGAGHMAVRGRLAQRDQAIEFGFALCPSLLSGMIAAFDDITEGRDES
jgi:hypothetical protein